MRKILVGRDMPDFIRLLLAAVLGAGLMLAGFAVLDNSTPTAGSAGSSAGEALAPDNALLASGGQPDANGASLAAQVAGLQRSQQQLLAELAALRSQVEAAAGTAGPAPVTSPARVPPAQSALTVERLAATGVAADDAEALVERLDELALARLEAGYEVRQAASSGDPDAQRAAREARRQVPADGAAIRAEFGDATYDNYLYASGQPNRVAVSSVLRSSTAVGAGVEAGDYLRSLDGQPLYSVRDLTARIREGSPDQTYALTIERDGQTLEVWVPGGPLGVRVNGATVAPGN